MGEAAASCLAVLAAVFVLVDIAATLCAWLLLLLLLPLLVVVLVLIIEEEREEGGQRGSAQHRTRRLAAPLRAQLPQKVLSRRGDRGAAQQTHRGVDDARWRPADLRGRGALPCMDVPRTGERVVVLLLALLVAGMMVVVVVVVVVGAAVQHACSAHRQAHHRTQRP